MKTPHLLFVFPALILAFAGVPEAEAQCPNGATTCVSASASVSVSASATVTTSSSRTRAPQRRDTRRVVVVQDSPPPVRQRVVVQQPPPQAPAPQQVYVEQAPPPQAPLTLEPDHHSFAVNAYLAAAGGQTGLGAGVLVGPRFYLGRVFSVELSTGLMLGRVQHDTGNNDSVGDPIMQNLRHVEIPLNLDLRFTFPPSARFRFVVLAGPNMQAALSTPINNYGEASGTRYASLYLGGHLGVGGEWQMGSQFAMSAGFRAFIRHRVTSGDSYEYEYWNPETRQVTNTSVGGLLTFGLHWLR